MEIAPLRKLIIPLGLILAGTLLRQSVTELQTAYGQLLIWLPYMTLGVALVLCVFFNLSRLFTATLAMLFTYFLVQTHLQSSLQDPSSLLIYTSISLAMPSTILVLLLVPERGLNNLYGVLLVSIIPLQVCLLLIMYHLLPVPELIPTIHESLPIKLYDGYVLSIPASIWYFLVLVTGCYILIRHKEESIAALLGILMFSYVTIAFFDQTRISTVMFAAAGVSMIISILKNSYDMAFRDELTGLLGRRALNDRLKGLGRQYVIAMVDVDHFKKFNDTYGHDTGDDVLKMVANRINQVGGGGTAYRYGGEEFCILFTGKTADDCIPFLEVIRKSVENHKMVVRNVKQRPRKKETALQRRGRRSGNRDEKVVSVTISIGVAERDAQISQTHKVLKAADNALYIAKKDGRNCLRMPEA